MLDTKKIVVILVILGSLSADLLTSFQHRFCHSDFSFWLLFNLSWILFLCRLLFCLLKLLTIQQRKLILVVAGLKPSIILWLLNSSHRENFTNRSCGLEGLLVSLFSNLISERSLFWLNRLIRNGSIGVLNLHIDSVIDEKSLTNFEHLPLGSCIWMICSSVACSLEMLLDSLGFFFIMIALTQALLNLKSISETKLQSACIHLKNSTFSLCLATKPSSTMPSQMAVSASSFSNCD